MLFEFSNGCVLVSFGLHFLVSGLCASVKVDAPRHGALVLLVFDVFEEVEGVGLWSATIIDSPCPTPGRIVTFFSLMPTKELLGGGGSSTVRTGSTDERITKTCSSTMPTRQRLWTPQIYV